MLSHQLYPQSFQQSDLVSKTCFWSF